MNTSDAKMNGAVLVAIAASIGNMLQGWDNATIAGALLYIKREFKLENEPTVEGLIVAMSLIGATIITLFSGAVSDAIGRRPMLIASSILYFAGSLLMLWSPNVHMLLLARLVDGFGIGLAVTLVPVYISETAPSDIRGLLNTLPQFTGSGGMFLSYCMVFGMSLTLQPNWRLMLGVLSAPSLLSLALAVLFLPESPRWLVSKGRMMEAQQVLQRLRGKKDVSEEMALLVEGLAVGGETSIEEYIIGPMNEIPGELDAADDKDKIVLYGPEEHLSWVARPVTGQSLLGSFAGLGSRQESMVDQTIPLMDPLVAMFDSVHEKLPETAGNLLLGSILSISAEQRPITELWDEENALREGEEHMSGDHAKEHVHDSLRSPLLSRQGTSTDGIKEEGVSSVGIGGGWHLAWKWSAEGELKKIYMHQEVPGAPGSRGSSIVSLPGISIPEEDDRYVQAAALVSHSALHSKEFKGQHPVGPAMVHPSEVASKRPNWVDLFEPSVRHALLVGMGIQILQQFSGISGVLYYTPQILEQAGVGVLLANMGIGSASGSILISNLSTLLMLPCIVVAMRLMDASGRRSLLLTTIPVLITSLFLLVVADLVDLGAITHAILNTVGVVVYICCFVMGFGPVPNILCSEIFPTRVRGMCIAICSLTFWLGNIAVSYTLPVMLNSIGLAGVFGIYAVVCLVALVFIFLKVPETKGMPLEVITEFFNVGTKQIDKTD